MPLVNMTDMLKTASQGSYAVCAFNVDNMELVRAVVEAAEAEQAPVILEITYQDAVTMGIEVFSTVGKMFAEAAEIPVALHLDHGLSFDQCKECLDGGFTSVMIDCSKKSFDENVSETARVVQYAKQFDATVEGEVGTIPGVKDQWSDMVLSDPHEVRRFCEATGIDCVAVSIGTVHYMMRKPLELDFGRLNSIRKVVGVPLVLHGGAAVRDEDMQKAVRHGISKYNIMYKTHKAFASGLREGLDQLDEEIAPGVFFISAFGILRNGLDAVVRDCRSKIRLLGSSGKA